MMLPFTLSSGIFIIFFWIDITSRSLYHGAFLDRCFWPAIILSGICSISIFCTAILGMMKGWNGSEGPVIGLTGFMFILLGVCSIIYFVAAKSLIRYNKERKDSPLRDKEFNKLIIKIIASGIVMILIILVSPLQWVRTFGSTFSSIYITFTGYVLWSIRSYLLIDLFGTPPKQISKSTTAPKSSQPLGTNSTPPAAEL